MVAFSLISGCAGPGSGQQVQAVQAVEAEAATTLDAPLPQLITRNGKHSFWVDGKAYLILGAQANNSANYPAVLDKVWPVVEQMSANTLSIPVAWEQIEPEEGKFDFSYLDVLLQQARERDLRLSLLWFATWKNNAPHYAPAWVKTDNKRFPRVMKQDGSVLNSLSPLGKNTLQADKKAFVRLMQYLKDHDPQHTVIMVQIENEVGTYGSKRDFSAMAEAVFQQQVPTELTEKLGLKVGTWQQVFAEDADENFHAYHIASFCEELAQAGKAIKNLPMNVNVALRNPFHPGDGYSMGGPTDNVLGLWRIAAPSVDMISPDIYFRDHKTVDKVLDLYSRADNPLFVAEIGNDQPYARYFFSTLGHQGIGFSPFGMDYTDYANYPLGAKTMDENTIAPFAELYQLVRPFAEVWAKLSFESEVWGLAEPHDSFTEQQKIWNANATEQQPAAADIKPDPELFTQRLDLGLWNVEITYGRKMFWIDPPVGNSPASGGVLIAKLSENEYLVTALRARVSFSASDELAASPFIARVEEGHFEQGKWVFERVWNGDQTDWGLNFTSKPHLLKVTLSTYQH